MKKIYTYNEIKDKINSGDSIKCTEIEKMLFHLMLHYTCLEWERDVAREEAETIREIYNALNFPQVTFPWEEGSK